jgi:hypothetical protein
MKKILTLLLIISLNVTNFAQTPKVEWSETFGFMNDDGFFAVERANGSYVVAGYYTNINNIRQGWIINVSNDGLKYWEKKFKYPEENVISDIVINKNYTYTAVGYTYERKSYRRDMIYLKISSTGQITKKNTVGGKYKDGAVNVIRTPDGGNIISAYFSSKEKTSNWLYSVNKYSTLLWEKKFSLGIDNQPVGTALGPNNTIFACYNYMVGNMMWQVAVNKLKYSNGFMLDTFIITKKYTCKANDFIATQDSNFIVCGYSYEKNKQKDFWVAKFTPTGKILWEKSFGWSMNEEANAIYQKITGNYIVCGYTESKGKGMYDIWVMELDKNGNKIWEKTIGTEANDIAYDCCEADDGGVIIVGSKFNGNNKVDGVVIKLK